MTRVSADPSDRDHADVWMFDVFVEGKLIVSRFDSKAKLVIVLADEEGGRVECLVDGEDGKHLRNADGTFARSIFYGQVKIVPVENAPR